MSSILAANQDAQELDEIRRLVREQQIDDARTASYRLRSRLAPNIDTGKPNIERLVALAEVICAAAQKSDSLRYEFGEVKLYIHNLAVNLYRDAAEVYAKTKSQESLDGMCRAFRFLTYSLSPPGRIQSSLRYDYDYWESQMRQLAPQMFASRTLCSSESAVQRPAPNWMFWRRWF